MKNPNGYGTVYKLSGNRRKPFIARVTAGWTDDGRQIFQTVGYFKSRKEANMALAAYNSDPYDITSRKLTFADIYERWSERKFEELSSHRVRQYKSIYSQVEEFHDKTFADLRLVHIQKFFDERKDVSSDTLVHYKALFNQLYKFAMKHEVVSKNHAQFVEIKKTEKPKPHKIFTVDELWTLWDNHEDEDVQLILVLIYTGLRITELLTMEQENIFLEERYMIGGIKTQSGKERIIPISKKILPFIEKLMDGSQYLVRKRDRDVNSPYGYDGFRNAVWRPTMKRFGFQHSIHDTRHTAISLMDAAGVNRLALKRIVGHKTSDVTDGYTHKNIEELVAEIDKL